jgi:hypothetical protein
VKAKDISRDLIKAIDRLNSYKNMEDVEKNLDNFHNPISELITPEWYYSDCFRVLDNIEISWKNLGESDLIRTLSDVLERAIIREGLAGIEFERSFCSWYQSYHYLPREKWGIHMRYDSLVRIASLFYHHCPSTVNRKLDSAKSAFLYLFIHEVFHHIIENATSILEIVSGKSNLYVRYYTDVYSQVFNSSDCIEETLSNVYLFQWADKCRIDRDFLKQELLKQGPGYCQFIQYVDSNFPEGNRILLSQIRQGRLKPTTYDPIEQVVDVPDPFQYSAFHNIPIWVHHKAKPVH